MIVAKEFKMIAEGVTPYLKRVQDAIAKHYDSIYLMTREGRESFFDSVKNAVSQNTTARLMWQKQFKTKIGKKRRVYATVCLFRV